MLDTGKVQKCDVAGSAGRYVNGVIVTTLSQVAHDYITSGQFFFDCFTSVPVSWVEFSTQHSRCDTDEQGMWHVY
jgi:hypothetical protein